MFANEIKNLCESTRLQLKQAMDQLETFLNEHKLADLLQDQDESMEEFYKGFLNDLRHLSVFTEVGYEKLGLNLRRPNFNEEQAQRALYDVYHQCVNRFYFPAHECYSEEGRYAYTGQDAIRFRKKPSRLVRNIVLELSKLYEKMREELHYYESEYVNQRMLQGEKV